MASHVINPHRADIAAGEVRAAPTRRLAALLARLGDRFDGRRRYRATVRELSELDDAILADIGIHRGQIELVAREVAAHRRWR